MSHSIIAELRDGAKIGASASLQLRAAYIIEDMEHELNRLRARVTELEEANRKLLILNAHTTAVSERAAEMAQELAKWSERVKSGGKP